MNKDHDVLGEGETADKDNVSSPLHVHGDGETTDKKVKERRNSELHAYNFPFAGAFRGAGWNCQSLFAYGLEFTQKYVMELASKHDFIGLSETRGTEERNATLGNAFSHNHEYFYSDLDQFKGGIGLLVQKSFLRIFSGDTGKGLDRHRAGSRWLSAAPRSGRHSAYFCMLFRPFLYDESSGKHKENCWSHLIVCSYAHFGGLQFCPQ